MTLPDIRITDECGYIAAFLTMRCRYNCSYCINKFESPGPAWSEMTGEQWIEGLSRLTNLERSEGGSVPVTLCGGEPSQHPDFYEIINGVPDRIRLDILTNLDFQVQEMIDKVDPARLKRNAPYASIRVTYHPGETGVEGLLARVLVLQNAGFSVGIWGVLHPDLVKCQLLVQQVALDRGIDYRTKPFLGYHDGKLYGDYKYPDACDLERYCSVNCRSKELLISPSGCIHRCHADLFEDIRWQGNIVCDSFPDVQMREGFQVCAHYGHCNPCDVKIKTNRLQQPGYTSVEIR